MIWHHHQASATVNVLSFFCLPSLVVCGVEMGEPIVIFTCLFLQLKKKKDHILVEVLGCI